MPNFPNLTHMLFSCSITCRERFCLFNCELASASGTSCLFYLHLLQIRAVGWALFIKRCIEDIGTQELFLFQAGKELVLCKLGIYVSQDLVAVRCPYLMARLKPAAWTGKIEYLQ